MLPNDNEPTTMARKPSETGLVVSPRTEIVNAGTGSALWRNHWQMASAPAVAEPDAARFLRALRRRWMLILGLGSVLAAMAAAAAWFLLAPKYTAFALVHVAAQPPRTVALPSEHMTVPLAGILVITEQVRCRTVEVVPAQPAASPPST